MEEITIYKFQLESILEALRLTMILHNSKDGATCFDRQVRQSYKYVENALQSNKDARINYITGECRICVGKDCDSDSHK